MPATLRSATRADLPAVLELWRESGAAPTRTDDLAGLVALLERDAGALMVAVEDGCIVGTVIAAFDGWRGALYRLAVVPRWRRRGLARQLVDEATFRLWALGARRLGAVVVADDADAVGFWEKSDWERQDERVRDVRDVRTLP